MFLISVAALFVCSFAVMFPYGTSTETFSADTNVSCAPNQTQCALGCCPYADAVCCSDGYDCCRRGQTCIPFAGICIGIQIEDGDTSLVESKSTPIKSPMLPCPVETTACGPDKCCRYSHATCCPDGQHCCPHGYRCDDPHETCIRELHNELDRNWSDDDRETVTSALKTFKKSPFKFCPGGGRFCPSYMNCCMNDNAEWGCCPNPLLPELQYGDGECCITTFGHMCCPNEFPSCTFFGCRA